ncbi:MAG: hypothetical protein NVSMB65_07400 [Chloroflexota bacterium]
MTEEHRPAPAAGEWDEWVPATDGHRFAHPSERLVSRVFDLCRLRWEYEPRTFVLRRSAEGGVVEGFTPDFFLPDLDLYLEVTTLRQDLTTRKHRKIRRVRDLYAGVNVHILHRKDCEALRHMLVRGRLPRHQVQRALTIITGENPSETLVARAAYHTRLQRVVDALGDIRLHNQLLHAHNSLAGQRVLVWIYPQWLEIAHAGRTVARYQCRYDTLARHVMRPTRPRHYAAGLPRQRRLPALPRPRGTARKIARPVPARRAAQAGAEQLPLALDWGS